MDLRWWSLRAARPGLLVMGMTRMRRGMTRRGCVRGALAATLLLDSTALLRADTDRAVESLVNQRIRAMLSADGKGGAAVAVRIEGRTLFFNYGLTGRPASRPIPNLGLFNLDPLRNVFEAPLLAQ